ncbi:DUF6249 domain-containing protein [Bacteroides sp. 224]|uniref:DUF6249 domain-containing protein n=1 Tax=Bacteroides sp. 224 TaxID=2302936 RepID=UPI0013CF86C5|nr:DUF6249 domain-containing protein [Bacteroides sp. 224]NDV65359.1 hypothetical protein [Bacteroides sp. 224]
MMDFIMIPAIIGIITLGIYKLFELFARRKERLALIEKLTEVKSFPNEIRFPKYFSSGFSFGALKAGSLLIGIGLGLLVGYLICCLTIPDYIQNAGNWKIERFSGIIYGACIFVLGGIGLITAFVIELKLGRSKKE